MKVLQAKTFCNFWSFALDNAIYRAGFATSRRQARQLVSHGHFLLNGRRVDIPSIRLKAGDEIVVRPKSQKSGYFTNLENVIADAAPAPLSWLKADGKKDDSFYYWSS